MSYQIQADIEQMRQTVRDMRAFSELLHDNRKRLDQKVVGFLSDLFRGNLQSMFETAITTLNPEVWKLSGTMDDLAQRLEQLAQRIEDADKSLRLEYLGKPIPPRIYIVNGIGSQVSLSEHGSDAGSNQLELLLQSYGYPDKEVVATEAVYKKISGENEHLQKIRNIGEVMEEYHLGERGHYTNQTFDFIEQDLKNNPLLPGQKIVLVGHSGGGAIVSNLPNMIEQRLGADVQGVVTMGSPVVNVDKARQGAESVVMIREDSDLVGTPMFRSDEARVLSKITKPIDRITGVNSTLVTGAIADQIFRSDDQSGVKYVDVDNQKSHIDITGAHSSYWGSGSTIKVISDEFPNMKDYIHPERFCDPTKVK